jgi:hypothetical protein
VKFWQLGVARESSCLSSMTPVPLVATIGTTGTPELFLKCGNVEVDTVLFRDIDHVQRDDHGQPKFHELRSQVEIPLDVRCVDHADHYVRPRRISAAPEQYIPRNGFVR